MKRKLIQMANKTLVMSLPIAIVRKYGLKKGNELEITETDGQVRIHIKNKLDKTPQSLKSNEKLIKEQLELAYIRGDEELKVFYEDKKVLKKIIQNINKRLINFQVLDSNNNYCTIKSIGSEYETNINQIIRRIFFLLLSLLETNDEDNEETLVKLTNTCKRILHQKDYNLQESIPIYNLIQCVTDFIEVDLKDKKQHKELIESIYKLYYQFNQEEYTKIKEELIKKISTSKRKGDNFLFLHNAKKMLELTILKDIQANCILQNNISL